MEKFQTKLVKIAGDASFRQFYRKYTGRKTSIIVKAKREKFKNLVTYVAINNFLRKNKILAPKTLEYFFLKGEIEIEDFGNVSLFKYIKRTRKKYKIYKETIDFLLKMQKIKPRKSISALKKYTINLNYYDRRKLHEESDLFFDWYLTYILGKKKARRHKILIRRELDKIYRKICIKNNCFVHRDFHASNLMLMRKEIGILDSQDAIIGNPAYDLVSLIDDVRIKIPMSLKKKIFYMYIKKTSKINRKKIKEFINDFNILSVQRNLKIIGIFYRLFKRDKKRQYLRFIPYTWQLIEMRSKNAIFRDLNFLLKNAVSKKLRKRILYK